jgi:hypothetical protein
MSAGVDTVSTRTLKACPLKIERLEIVFSSAKLGPLFQDVKQRRFTAVRETWDSESILSDFSQLILIYLYKAQLLKKEGLVS